MPGFVREISIFNLSCAGLGNTFLIVRILLSVLISSTETVFPVLKENTVEKYPGAPVSAPLTRQ